MQWKVTLIPSNFTDYPLPGLNAPVIASASATIYAPPTILVCKTSPLTD